jgi:hypothetical protein
MAKYKKSFTLNVRDIELIEDALREKIRVLARILLANGNVRTSESESNEAQLRELTELMGKIHNQKIFYGSVHHTGAPISG